TFDIPCTERKQKSEWNRPARQKKRAREKLSCIELRSRRSKVALCFRRNPFRFSTLRCQSFSALFNGRCKYGWRRCGPRTRSESRSAGGRQLLSRSQSRQEVIRVGQKFSAHLPLPRSWNCATCVTTSPSRRR